MVKKIVWTGVVLSGLMMFLGATGKASLPSLLEAVQTKMEWMIGAGEGDPAQPPEAVSEPLAEDELDACRQRRRENRREFKAALGEATMLSEKTTPVASIAPPALAI